MTKSESEITVIIPTHRREPVGLALFLVQTKHVWILNNGMVPISNEFLDRISNISVEWKGHGRTRQEILSKVQTEFVFFSVDDATPKAGMLDSLLQTISTEDCDAVIPRQVPYPDASPITVQALEAWTPKGEGPYPVPQADHVGTLYRTETLRNYPIPDVSIAEDAWWSKGRKILCDPNAEIIHSHPRRTRALFARELAIHQELRKMGRKNPIGTLDSEVLGIIGNVQRYGIREGARTGAEILARRIAWFGI
jgi:hypothetical protein